MADPLADVLENKKEIARSENEARKDVLPTPTMVPVGLGGIVVFMATYSLIVRYHKEDCILYCYSLW